MTSKILQEARMHVETYPLNNHNWFHFLKLASQQEFLLSQEGFYYAVKSFPRMLAKLASLIEDSETRLLVVENIWEEHGQGNPKLFHTNSYYQYLQSLGLTKNIQDIEHNPWVDEWISSVLSKDLSASQYAAYLGGIEYIYARISNIISEHIQNFDLKNEQTHYAKHGVLDYDHAAELLEVCINSQYDETDGDLLGCFQSAIQSFLQMFDKMVRLTEAEAKEIAKEKIAFYYAREDTTIECDVVSTIRQQKNGNKVKVLMICSGGENSIELLKLDTPVDIMALDINPHQIALAKEKIESIATNGSLSDKLIKLNEGKFEKLFEVLKNSFIRKELEEIRYGEESALKKLKFVCDNLFSNKTLEIIFTEEATKYSKESFSEHFYNVFAHQIKQFLTYHPEFSNIGCVLGLATPIDYTGKFNKNSTIDYFNGSFEAYFSAKNEKYDVIDVSNISDWMSKERTVQTIKLLYSQLNEGGCLIGRKLLGDYDWVDLIQKDCSLAMNVQQVQDQTSFYTQTVIAQK